jgi:diguanylate cyclase (GGDEF)-like protein/PAS domain S-box-containing protein
MAVDLGLANNDNRPVRHRLTAMRGLDPTRLAYLMGPVAFATLLFLMHLGYIARQSAWLWLGVFICIPMVSVIADHVYDGRPNRLTLNLRIAIHVASVTAVIYLSGWGPVLWGTYAFVALENIAHSGSGVWRTTVTWSLIGMALGQILVEMAWFPSELTRTQATAMTIMGAFVLLFVVRMAGAIMAQKESMMAQKEVAETTLRLSEDRFRSLVQNSSDVTMILDERGNIRYISPAVLDLLGYQPEEVIGLRATDLVHPDDEVRVRQQLGVEFQSTQGTSSLEFRMVCKNKTPCDVEAVVSNQVARPSVGGYVANIRDITERKKFEALLAHRALHDSLTGLANHQLTMDRADQMLVRARRSGEPVAAYFIDLDNFKDTNDSLGHRAGDLLLKEVADRLQGLLRASDTVGRLGGDEFVILAEGMSVAPAPEIIADRVIQALKLPFHLNGFERTPITISASIGIAYGDRSSAEELLRDADMALYCAKEAGRAQSVIFEPRMQTVANDRLVLKTDLDLALTLGQFFLLYQPIFDLHPVRIQGAEALIRWDHPIRGTVGPDTFIPALEESGLIVEVGRWVLQEACRQAAAWEAEGRVMTMAINVSMRQLESDEFVDDVRNALAFSGVDPTTVVIEVTESVLMKDTNATVGRLQRLKDIGVKIAIDDFGTGYSSLAHLRQFPVDILKIDRSFVSEMSGSQDGVAFIRTLVEFGHMLGLATLAEGIEEQAQLEELQREHCDFGQGFFFSRPVAASEFEGMLSTLEAVFAG